MSATLVLLDINTACDNNQCKSISLAKIRMQYLYYVLAYKFKKRPVHIIETKRLTAPKNSEFKILRYVNTWVLMACELQIHNSVKVTDFSCAKFTLSVKVTLFYRAREFYEPSKKTRPILHK